MTDKIKVEMTDAQIDMVTSVLGLSTSEEVKALRNIMKTNVNQTIGEGPQVIETHIDQDTGFISMPGNEYKAEESDVSASDLIDKEVFNTDIKKETFKGLKDFGMSEKDTMKLMNTIIKYKNKEKFNVYAEMPEPIKKMVVMMCPSRDLNAIKIAARDLLDHFIRDMYIDQEVIDFQSAIKKELNIPDIADMFNEKLKESMEVGLLKKADIIQSSSPEKAELLRGISRAYTDAYSMASLLDTVTHNEIIRRKLKKDNSRYKRICNSFNSKYTKESKFKINDVKMLEKILLRRLPDTISNEDIISFIIVFCKYCIPLSSDNVIEHTFMYYTIKNILLLDHIDNTQDFAKNLLDNITRVINSIKVAKLVVESNKDIESEGTRPDRTNGKLTGANPGQIYFDESAFADTKEEK